MMKKSLFSLCLLSVFSLLSWSTSYGQYRFSELDKAITQGAYYDHQKEEKIVELRKGAITTDNRQLFDRYERLYQEYQVFNYDSAYSYALKQLELARRLNDSELVSCSRLNLGFVLLSAGLFKEAIDTLHVINTGVLQEPGRLKYYTLMARYYYDLADYTMDRYHSPKYNDLGNRYLDSALRFQTETFDRSYYLGLKSIRSGDIDAAQVYLEELARTPALTLHQQALATSTLSDIYIQKGQLDTAISLLVRAAIADIRSSTKETSAIFNLSTLLFKKGDLKNASAYIEKAVEDAVSYGARQRKVQMSTILPLIEGEKIARVESEKKTLITYAVLVTVLLLLLVYLIVVITRQNKKLKSAQKALTLAHQEQQEVNARLEEANKIKEEYIGFFFNSNTAFYDKMEQFKRRAEKKIIEGKLDEVAFLIKNLNIRMEREELLKNFDTIFLKIFPHFVASYNRLFKSDEYTQLKENEVLNTELRIFALIRLGIHDNDKIAAILGYSVNTINTYKTRIKNRSIVPNEQFEDRILEIKSV